MSRRCNETIKTLSESTGIDRDEDVKNPLAHVLKVLNYQMTSLKWVEQTSNSVSTPRFLTSHFFCAFVLWIIGAIFTLSFDAFM